MQESQTLKLHTLQVQSTPETTRIYSPSREEIGEIIEKYQKVVIIKKFKVNKFIKNSLILK